MSKALVIEDEATEEAKQADIKTLIRQFQEVTGSSVNRVGNWPRFVVTIDDTAFDVQALVDGVSIMPMDHSALARAYAREVEALLQFWRRVESDAPIQGKIFQKTGGAPTLATVILQAILEFKTGQAVGAFSASAHRFGG